MPVSVWGGIIFERNSFQFRVLNFINIKHINRVFTLSHLEILLEIVVC